MIKAYIKFWKNYVNFTGRASRSDYWWVVLINTLFVILFGILIWYALVSQGTYSALFIGSVVIAILLLLASYIPILSLLTRRLNDLGLSWKISLSLVVVDIVTNFLPIPFVLDSILAIGLIVLTILPTGALSSKPSEPHQGDYFDFPSKTDDSQNQAKSETQDDSLSNPF